MTTNKDTTPAPLRAATDEALPCPFCGHCGPLHIGDGSTFRWIIASCDQCGATRGETRVQTLGEGTRDEWLATAKAEAIAEWNQRAPAPVAHRPAVTVAELPGVYLRLSREVDAYKAGNAALLEALMDMVLQHCCGEPDDMIRHAYISANENAVEVLEQAGMIENDRLNWPALQARKQRTPQTWADAVNECVTDPAERARLLAFEDEPTGARNEQR